MSSPTLVSVPTDTILVRPSFGATAILNYPLTGLLSSGKSLGVAGFGIPFFLFFDSLFDGMLDSRKMKSNLPYGSDNNIDDSSSDYKNDNDWWMSWDDQQSYAIEWVEKKIESYTGLDGRLCGLRFVCEMQHHPIHRFSLLGETISLLFSFSNGTSNDVLQEYARAEAVGQDLPDGDTCYQLYNQCPVSVFKVFGGTLNQGHLAN